MLYSEIDVSMETSKQDRMLLFNPEIDRWQVYLLANVVAIRAEERHSRFYFNDGRNLLLKYHGINKTFERLKGYEWLVQVNRSDVINMQFVNAIESTWEMIYLIRKIGKYSFVSVGRKYKQNFQKSFSNNLITFSSCSLLEDKIFVSSLE